MANGPFEYEDNLRCDNGFMLLSLIFCDLAEFGFVAPEPGLAFLVKVLLLEQTNDGD